MFTLELTESEIGLLNHLLIEEHQRCNNSHASKMLKKEIAKIQDKIYKAWDEKI